MYEKLTNLLPELSDSKAGEWIIDHKNDGTEEHPIQFPFVVYAEAVTKLEDNIYAFEKEHPELSLNKYSAILEEQGVKWDMRSMSSADVSAFTGQQVAALLLGAVRAEHFCDGALKEFVENGSVKRWLERLAEIDNTASFEGYMNPPEI